MYRNCLRTLALDWFDCCSLANFIIFASLLLACEILQSNIHSFSMCCVLYHSMIGMFLMNTAEFRFQLSTRINSMHAKCVWLTIHVKRDSICHWRQTNSFGTENSFEYLQRDLIKTFFLSDAYQWMWTQCKTTKLFCWSPFPMLSISFPIKKVNKNHVNMNNTHTHKTVWQQNCAFLLVQIENHNGLRVAFYFLYFIWIQHHLQYTVSTENQFAYEMPPRRWLNGDGEIFAGTETV